MALPSLSSLAACADYSHTVEPFLPTLYALPGQVGKLITSADGAGLAELYTATNPFVSGLAFSIAAGAVFWLVAEVNKNYSQIDRMWSILPAAYIWHFAVWARRNDLEHDRVDLLVAWASLWSARLTYNYWRRGGYSIGSEDYRWAIVKKFIGPAPFFVLNATFISFMQSVLLYLFAAPPAYVVLLANQLQTKPVVSDYVMLYLQFCLVVLEFISDGQQWEYQTAKHQYQKTSKLPQGFHRAPLDRGFITTGLWAISRHPNCLFEQAIWLSLYQWSCLATGVLYSWAGIGAALLLALFQSSTWLTELITASKYPAYADYQAQVGKFLPVSLTPYEPGAGTDKPEKVPLPKVVKLGELSQKNKKEL